MKYEKKDAIDLNGNYALLDISVDNNPSTAKCKITEQYLECESQHSPKTKDNIIKIEGNTILGTIHFSPNLLESQKSFKTIELSMTFSKIEGFKYENGKIEFKVKGNLKDNLEAEIDKNTIAVIPLKYPLVDNQWIEFLFPSVITEPTLLFAYSSFLACVSRPFQWAYVIIIVSGSQKIWRALTTPKAPKKIEPFLEYVFVLSQAKKPANKINMFKNIF